MRSINQSKQQGIALATSLVVLVMLTLLTMTSMNTSTLEEKMAVSVQQEFLSFQAAESGLNAAFDVPGSLETENSIEWQDTIGNTVTRYQTLYREKSDPPLDSGWSTDFTAYYYDVVVSARVGRSQSNVRAGIYQIAPD